MMRSSILSEINDCIEDEDEDESEQSCNFPIVIDKKSYFKTDPTE